MKYNVLREKWIPMSDGRKYGLLECLEHAHELERISCTSPLETYALHRLLCVFVMDALQLPNKASRMALLKQGHFDMSIFEAYIKMCEEKGVSFDLFDDKRPFMQAEYNPHFDKEKSVSAMLLNVPHGNNHIFFEHKYENEHRLAIDDAFRSMLALFTFCPKGGRGYFLSVNGAPCLYAVILGSSLFDTLLNNIISIKEAGNLPYGLPCWRDMTMRVPKEKEESIELLKGMTWQPRKVNLISTPDGFVEKIFFTSARKPPSDERWRDPHVPYRMNKDGTYSPIVPQEGRSLWRDLGGMTVSKEERFGRRPQVIASLQSDSSKYKIAVTGLITNGNAKLIDVVYEEAVLPYKVLNVIEYGEEFRDALQFVEDIYTIILNEGVKKKLGIKKGNKKNNKTIVTDAINGFLATAKDYLLGTYLKALIDCNSDEEFVHQRNCLKQWLRKQLTRTLDQLLVRIGIDGHNLQRISEFKENVLSNFDKLRSL